MTVVIAQEEMKAALLRIASSAASRPVTEDDLTRPFEDIGLDSLAVVGIVGDMEDAVDMELSIDLVKNQSCLLDVLDTFLAVANGSMPNTVAFGDSL